MDSNQIIIYVLQALTNCNDYATVNADGNNKEVIIKLVLKSY